MSRMIKDLLIGKNSDERANIKAREIAKVKSIPRTNVKFLGVDYDIEVVDIRAIEGGVEVFARAWSANCQIGFGADGSVDIERFRIINPPILVDDPDGNIVKNTIRGVTLRLKEEPVRAILEILAHTISVKKEKFNDQKIVFGKVGSTTTTVFPDADPESTSMDGVVRNAPAGGAAWATIRGAADGTSAFPSFDQIGAQISTDADNWNLFDRSFLLFDTSSIPDTDSISSATLSIYYDTDNTLLGGFSQSVVIVTTTPASNTDFTTADYDQFGTVDQATRIAHSAITLNQYTNFTLNAAGRGNISKTGVTKFGDRLSGDADNSEPTFAANTRSGIVGRSAEQAGTTKDPKLVIEHAPFFESNFLLFMGPQPQV